MTKFSPDPGGVIGDKDIQKFVYCPYSVFPIIDPIVCKVKVVDSKKSVTGAGLSGARSRGRHCVIFRVHTLHI